MTAADAPAVNTVKEFFKDRQQILVILAHPDDPEFFCGATLAQWALDGHHIAYCLLTKGDKGTNEQFPDNQQLSCLRMDEQRNAASVIGVQDITFLNNPDGYLQPTLDLRKQIVRIIRQKRPDIVVSCDPTNYYMRDVYINHPDHRAAGQAVIDAVFPAAQNPDFFPELQDEEGLQPHHVQEVWLSLPKEPNVIFNVTDTWQIKLSALHEHKSQIGDVGKFDQRMLERRSEESTRQDPRFEESFLRIILRR